VEDRHDVDSYAIVRRTQAITKTLPSTVSEPGRPRANHPVVRIALGAIVFRVLTAILACLSNIVFPDYQDQGLTMFGAPSPFWDTFVRHDSGWYFQIARTGFHYTPEGRDTIAFFPVYPLMMRYVGRA